MLNTQRTADGGTSGFENQDIVFTIAFKIAFQSLRFLVQNADLDAHNFGKVHEFN